MSRSRRPRLTQLEDRSVPATLSGSVFADVNANGVRDPGETGLAGVALQVDLLNDNTIELNAATDIDGNFSIVGLPDGAHSLHVIPPTGTSPVGAAAAVPFTIASGADVALQPIGLQPNGDVSGTVFNDLNNNGERDEGEPGLAGWHFTVTPLVGQVSIALTTPYELTTGSDPLGYASIELPVGGVGCLISGST